MTDIYTDNGYADRAEYLDSLAVLEERRDWRRIQQLVGMEE